MTEKEYVEKESKYDKKVKDIVKNYQIVEYIMGDTIIRWCVIVTKSGYILPGPAVKSIKSGEDEDLRFYLRCRAYIDALKKLSEFMDYYSKETLNTVHWQRKDKIGVIDPHPVLIEKSSKDDKGPND